MGAQQMQKGFTYLETGKYALAETFFDRILKDNPTNKTARLCYGRAVGLNRNSKKATVLFTALLEDYPDDFEIQLNYAESLLWDHNFVKAKAYYEQLVSKQPKSFPALLGYANTLSNLKNYEDALTYVDKALAISPDNPNALNSKKYIYLGYAYKNQQAQEYDKAEALLFKVLQLFKDDKDALLNLANLYIIWERLNAAETIYKKLAMQPEANILSLNGLALVVHLKGNNKKALQLSTRSYRNTIQDINLQQQTTERYIQALLWNKKYQAAETLIAELIDKYPNENWVFALRATLNLYKSNFKKSLSDYNKILKNDSTSFDGNLGKANVLKALGRHNDAYKWANKTLQFYTKQKDAIKLINDLDTRFSPTFTTKTAYTFDNGDNESFTHNMNITYPLSTKTSLLGNYNYRQTNNTITTNSAKANTFSLGLAYQIAPNVTVKGITGLVTAKTENNDYTQLLADVAVNFRAFKLQALDLGYKRQIETFNADLLNQELVQNNYYANYNLSTNFNLGWYTQYIYTSQNDSNKRHLLFTSLYYNVLSKPILKIGINYQYITFKNQVPNIYFSPETFNAGEVFINLVKDDIITQPKQWFYNMTAAFGYQFIDDNTKQGTYRFQGIFGYKFSERSLLNIYGTHSNIASANAAGFTFTEIGLRFKWVFLRDKI